MSSDKVTLNARGILVMVGKSTLEKLDYFKDELEKWSKTKADIFIDCDSKIFTHVQNCLAIDNYTIPAKYVHDVQTFLDYYSPKKKFIINAIPKGFVLTNDKFNISLFSQKKENEKQLLLEHNGILTLYCKVECHNVKYGYIIEPRFELKLWDAYNSINFYKLNHSCNIFYSRTGDRKEMHFKISGSILAMFQEKLYIQFTDFHHETDDYNLQCDIYIAFLKKK